MHEGRVVTRMVHCGNNDAYQEKPGVAFNANNGKGLSCFCGASASILRDGGNQKYVDIEENI